MSNWTLIYSTDRNGQATFGTVDALRTAVLFGAEVKVQYSPSIGVWWSRYCASVMTRELDVGGARVVSATYMEAADTKFGGMGLEFNLPFALEYHIYNSNGLRHFVKITYEDHRVVETDLRVVPMEWYVKDYALPPNFPKEFTIVPDFVSTEDPPATGRLTLNSPAPAGGIEVELKSSHSFVTFSESKIIFLQGESTKTFAIVSHFVPELESQTIVVDITTTLDPPGLTRQLTVLQHEVF